MKKTLLVFIFMLCVFSFISSIAVYAAQPSVEGEGAILMEASSGKILYAKDENKHWEPASVTKLMTLAVLMDALASGKIKMDDKIVASPHACSMGGSQVWLKEGEERTLRDMIIAIAVGSANDACVAVAEHLAGSEEGFVQLMNAKAKELGMTNTHFMNSHGLPIDNHYTTAKDMAFLARYSLRYPEILKFTSIKQFTFREQPKLLVLWNTNKLLWWFKGADGFKTGWTPRAKLNLAATAKRDNMRLISVVLGVEKPKGHFTETMKLFNYGFANYAFTKLYDANTTICKVEVIKGTKKELTLITARDVGSLHAKGASVKPGTKIEISGNPRAPIAKGQKLGEILVTMDNQVSERVELLAAESIPKATFLFTLKEILSKTFSFGTI